MNGWGWMRIGIMLCTAITGSLSYDVKGSARENMEMTLKCNGGQFSIVKSATYGAGSCQVDAMTVRHVIQEKCKGKMQCRLTPSPMLFGDHEVGCPPGVMKVLDVVIVCSPSHHRNDGDLPNSIRSAYNNTANAQSVYQKKKRLKAMAPQMFSRS
uniref:SUEL-type lectin domain-containing protein n=1 Tax=Spongospora subterranea TaxID=70186 RepID=A0A0H5QHZ4_9EUKA|eukprot:CRZ01675.1 hypothetical protein [Spongospora subterranea]